MKRIGLFLMLFFLSISIALAQDACESDFDCNGAVDAGDVATFLEDFGRSDLTGNPCPDCYDSPCPCSTPGCDPPAPVEKTGQITSYAPAGDDGALEKGVAWPNPRFTDNGDGTITDNLNGLVWLKDAFCFSSRNWYDALSACNELAHGQCDLTDSSNTGDWRLPNAKELLSLIDYGQDAPALPSGHPFNSVGNGYYWSSTSASASGEYAWVVFMFTGYMIDQTKTLGYAIWPVRGGQ